MALIVGSFFGRPAVPEATPYRPSQRFYARDQGLAGYDVGFEDGEASVQPDLTAPLIVVISPTVETTINRNTPVVIDVLAGAPAAALRQVVVSASMGGSIVEEVMHDSLAFVAPYISSTRQVVALGYRYTLQRTGGWRGSSFTVRVACVTVNGVQLIARNKWQLVDMSGYRPFVGQR